MIELALKHEFPDLAIDVEFSSTSRCLALFGDSGAGKTTILNGIAGLLGVQEGRIVLDGRTVLDRAQGIDVPPSDREVGYVFQDGRLFPHLSVHANLNYAARARKRPGAGFDQMIDLLDLGPLLRRRPSNLSGGERQRVAIGRALIGEPRILLLDEPLTGLHREARVQVLQYLRRLKQEFRVSTVLVSHQADEVAELADDVVMLQAGRVVEHVDVAAFAARRLPG